MCPRRPVPQASSLRSICEPCVSALARSSPGLTPNLQLSTFDFQPPFPLSPFVATDPKKHQLSPIIATLPKIPSRKSFVCHTSKTPQGVPLNPQTFKHSDVSTIPRAISFVLIHLRTLLHFGKTQLFCFHAIPHSLRKTPGVGVGASFRLLPIEEQRVRSVLPTKFFEGLVAVGLHLPGARLQVLVRLRDEQLQRNVQIAANNLIHDAKLIRLVDAAGIEHAADLEKAVAELDEVNARIDVYLATAEELLALVGILTGPGERGKDPCQSVAVELGLGGNPVGVRDPLPAFDLCHGGIRASGETGKVDLDGHGVSAELAAPIHHRLHGVHQAGARDAVVVGAHLIKGAGA